LLFPVMPKNSLRTLFILGGWLLVQAASAQDPKVLVNHLGYEQNAAKRAVILGHAGDEVTGFTVIDTATGKSVLSGTASPAGPVDQWKDWYFWTADFGSVKRAGTYLLACQTSRGEVRSFPFLIQTDLLEKIPCRASFIISRDNVPRACWTRRTGI